MLLPPFPSPHTLIQTLTHTHTHLSPIMSFPGCHHFFHYLHIIAEELLRKGKNILPWLVLIFWGLNFEFGVIVLLSACHVRVIFLTRDEAWPPPSPDVTAAKTNHSGVCLHVRQKGHQEVIAGTFFVVFLGQCPESYQSTCFYPTDRGYHDDRTLNLTGSPPLLPSCIDHNIPTYLDAMNTWLRKTKGNRGDLAQVSTP